ncbi:MAG: alpha/beta hydrolase-fold protein [Imperialibacter sp.]|uniref:alpha/beta hydrolase-fold protein n=1 Tax=Imperialibacter sp. TaxID=2038411 RepID=UPI0032EDDAA7
MNYHGLNNYAKIFLALVCLVISGHTASSQEQQSSYLLQLGMKDSVYSKVLKEQRDFWVQLPEGFNPESKTTYPVIYLLDGGAQLGALAAVYSYYTGHHLPDMILVGISNRTNRTRDLTTSEVKFRNGGEVREATGSAEAFTRFLETELIPYVDGKYPTSQFKTLIGHSYGGLFTINTLVNHTHVFDNYIAIDPSLDWDDQKLMKEAKEALKSRQFQRKSLFIGLGAGQLHMLDESVTLDNVMQDTSEYSLFGRSIIEFSRFAESQQQNGLSFSWKTYPDDYHWTVPLPALRDGLIRQFEWYQLQSPTKYSSPDTPLSELLTLIKQREKVLKDHFGYSYPAMPEELFIQTGYMYLQMGQVAKSEVFFKMGIEYYPGSANAYDSMADYYESQGDYANALANLTKAFEISGAEYYAERMKKLEKM